MGMHNNIIIMMVGYIMGRPPTVVYVVVVSTFRRM